MSEIIFDCEDAIELLMSRIIPEINEEIKRACNERRNYMIYTFNEDCKGNFIEKIISLYEESGYEISKNEKTGQYMFVW